MYQALFWSAQALPSFGSPRKEIGVTYQSCYHEGENEMIGLYFLGMWPVCHALFCFAFSILLHTPKSPCLRVTSNKRKFYNE